MLIVDDEDELRRISSAILRRCGYRVVDCDNGQEAVEMYSRMVRQGDTPDVVLMDLTLRGGMSGTETAAEILGNHPDAKLVVTSGSVTEELECVFIEQGFVDVLAKPYEAGELSLIVNKVARMAPPLLAAA